MSGSQAKEIAADAVSFSKAQAESNVVEVEITGGFQKRELKPLQSRARDICTDSTRKWTRAWPLMRLGGLYVFAHADLDMISGKATF